MCLNFAEALKQSRRCSWTEHAYWRLRRIKAAVHPGYVIHANHPVPPAR
jgi:hypothetical protein